MNILRNETVLSAGIFLNPNTYHAEISPNGINIHNVLIGRVIRIPKIEKTQIMLTTFRK